MTNLSSGPQSLFIEEPFLQEGFSSKATVFDMLKSIWEKDNNVSEEEAACELAEMVAPGSSQNRHNVVVYTYYVRYNLRSLRAQNKPVRVVKSRALPKTVKITPDRIEEGVNLLDQSYLRFITKVIFPHGKTLMKSTGKELRQYTGWWSRIHSIVADDEVIGDKLSVDDLLKMAKTQ